MGFIRKYRIFWILFVGIGLLIYFNLIHQSNTPVSNNTKKAPRSGEIPNGLSKSSLIPVKTPKDENRICGESQKAESVEPSEDNDEQMSDQEIAELLEEFLHQYNNREEMNSENILEENKEIGKKSDNNDIAWVRIGGRKYFLRPGEAVTVEGYGVGTWNPRPRTPEEQDRFNELCDEKEYWLRRLKEETDPEECRRIVERMRQITEELNKIKAETSLPAYTRIKVWVTSNE